MSTNAGDLLGGPSYLHAKPAYLVIMGLQVPCPDESPRKQTDGVGGKVWLTEAVLFHCNSHTRMVLCAKSILSAVDLLQPLPTASPKAHCQAVVAYAIFEGDPVLLLLLHCARKG